MEVGAGFCILRPFLVALLNLLEVLVDVLPLLFTSFRIPVVSQFFHAPRDLLPERALRPVLLVLRVHVGS